MRIFFNPSAVTVDRCYSMAQGNLSLFSHTEKGNRINKWYGEFTKHQDHYDENEWAKIRHISILFS